MSKQTKADAATTAAEEAVEQEFLAKQAGVKPSQLFEEIPPGTEPVPEPIKHPQQMSSTVSHEISNYDFAVLKLVN